MRDLARRRLVRSLQLQADDLSPSAHRLACESHRASIREAAVVATTTGLTVASVGHDVVVPFRTRGVVHIGATPRIERDRLPKIRTVPLRLARWPLDERF